MCRLYILRACSAGTVLSCLLAYQATSIHQHKSAQRGANCVRRPWLFSVARVCVGERERPCGWRERCLKKSGSDSAVSASARRLLCHLCSCWQRVPSLHTNKPTNVRLLAQQYCEFHMWSLWYYSMFSPLHCTQKICVDAGETKLWIKTSLRIPPFSLS